MYLRLAFAVAAHLEPEILSSTRCSRSATRSSSGAASDDGIERSEAARSCSSATTSTPSPACAHACSGSTAAGSDDRADGGGVAPICGRRATFDEGLLEPDPTRPAQVVGAWIEDDDGAVQSTHAPVRPGAPSCATRSGLDVPGSPQRARRARARRGAQHVGPPTVAKPGRYRVRAGCRRSWLPASTSPGSGSARRSSRSSTRTTCSGSAYRATRTDGPTGSRSSAIPWDVRPVTAAALAEGG